jgi:hypothetical protein
MAVLTVLLVLEWCMFRAALSIWSLAGTTALIVVSIASSLVWANWRTRRLLPRQRWVAALGGLAPVIVAAIALRTPDGNHLTTSYSRGLAMVSELENIEGADVAGYRKWNENWSDTKDVLLAWFPRLSEQVASKEDRWSRDAVANLRSQLQATAPEDGLHRIQAFWQDIQDTEADRLARVLLDQLRFEYELRLAIQEFQQTQESLLQAEQYEEALARADAFRGQWASRSVEVGLSQTVEEIYQKYAFWVELSRLATMASPTSSDP